MQQIFNFTSYRKYLTSWIEDQGSAKYGLKGKIAGALGISSSLMSQIFKEEKSLTPDQTSDLADYLGLNEFEAEYLHLLVEFDRAGNPRYKAKLEKRMKKVQQEARGLSKRVPRQKELNDTEKAIFYSSWIYTGIRTLSEVEGMNRAEHIAEHLGLPRNVVLRVLRFLVEHGLCAETENGDIKYVQGSTHVDRDSPFVNKHHQNWRFKALQRMEDRNEADLFFTSPMSLSREASEHIRIQIPNVIQEIMKVAGPSKAEQTKCLNIDWFDF